MAGLVASDRAFGCAPGRIAVAPVASALAPDGTGAAAGGMVLVAGVGVRGALAPGVGVVSDGLEVPCKVSVSLVLLVSVAGVGVVATPGGERVGRLEPMVAVAWAIRRATESACSLVPIGVLASAAASVSDGVMMVEADGAACGVPADAVAGAVAMGTAAAKVDGAACAAATSEAGVFATMEDDGVAGPDKAAACELEAVLAADRISDGVDGEAVSESDGCAVCVGAGVGVATGTGIAVDWGADTGSDGAGAGALSRMGSASDVFDDPPEAFLSATWA